MGWVGFVQVLPVIFLAIPVGHVIDRSNRKHVIMGAAALMAASSLGLAVASLYHAPLLVMYACLLASGVGRAFSQPAKAAFLPQIVPRDRFANAVTWNTGGFHLASIVGPLLAGVIIYVTQQPGAGLRHRRRVPADAPLAAEAHRGPAAPAGQRAAHAALAHGRHRLRVAHQADPGRHHARYVRRAAGGRRRAAADLCPRYPPRRRGGAGLPDRGAGRRSTADDVPAGPSAADAQRRAGPAVGGGRFRRGHDHLWPVARTSGFRWRCSSPRGMLDQISVVVRHTLVQLLTPDWMRGRVAAVNSMFIGASNELGGFESGLVAALFTPVISVVSGGIGTIAVVAAVALDVAAGPPLSAARRHDRRLEHSRRSRAGQGRGIRHRPGRGRTAGENLTLRLSACTLKVSSKLGDPHGRMAVMESVLAVFIGTGLAASCGFRVFVPLLVVSAASKAGYLGLADGFAWMGTWPALAAFAVATVLEIGAYYVPWLDHALDTIASPASVVAGTVLFAASVVEFDPLLKWSLAVIAGGGAAGVVQGGTVATRMASTATTGGLGNFAVTTLETIAGFFFSVLSIVLPVLAVLLLLVAIGGLYYVGRRVWRRLFARRAEADL